MNEKEAIEILKPFEVYYQFPHFEMGQMFTAKGYLEAIEKAKGLEEVIKKFIEFCVCETESDQFSKEAKEALAKWDKDK